MKSVLPVIAIAFATLTVLPGEDAHATNGINALLTVNQMKANNANDNALQSKPKPKLSQNLRLQKVKPPRR